MTNETSISIRLSQNLLTFVTDITVQKPFEMIIFNTTYHADNARKDEFIDWLKESYIPTIVEHGLLREPQLTRIFADNEDEGTSLSLQFKSPDTESLERWHEECGEALLAEMQKRFGDQVLGFSTLLEVIDL